VNTYNSGPGRVLRVRNVNEALPQALHLMSEHGAEAESRGMRTIRLPGPFLTVYTKPRERVLFDPVRNANPFFHMVDALWLLSGSNRVDLPRTYLSRISDFSDDGVTFHGAYGHRLRHAYGFDQIARACDQLKETPDSRQVVLSIWHPEMDLGVQTKDMPCNDMIMLDIVDGKLCMTVCNRSNDVVWGAYGANVVQFSMLQEYMAACIEVEVGAYVQMSNNFHVYENNPYWKAYRAGETHKDNRYAFITPPCPLALSPSEATLFFGDCVRLATSTELGTPVSHFMSAYFERVVRPMLAAYEQYRFGHVMHAIHAAEDIESADWRIACIEWLERRL
jgi:hypothetical protein